uniref:30S ribosomal protein 3, chloroplastic n=1 Tax=Ishige okamurae TaxID=233772 RepID=A0A8E5XRJ5_9PHAE|nr:hypothetical protein Ycf65 [Ishige okamurae]QVJ99651.1 hypothetical protein Ycf65 [Ishige okamurae]WAM64087.1 putative plastid-specific 30S ribosomal protein [Ishige okamurae]
MARVSNQTGINYVFKIIWGKNYLGLAVDRQIPNNLTSPITSLFFWPRENGWELLRAELSDKPWMTKEERIEILNGYTKIINYWLENVKEIEGITKLIQDSKKYKFKLVGNL